MKGQALERRPLGGGGWTLLTSLPGEGGWPLLKALHDGLGTQASVAPHGSTSLEEILGERHYCFAHFPDGKVEAVAQGYPGAWELQLLSFSSQRPL